MSEEKSLSEILRNVTEVTAGEVNQVAPMRPSLPQDYAPVDSSVPPEAKDIYRQLTNRGEELASSYERNAEAVLACANKYAEELRTLATQVRLESQQEGERVSRFNKRLNRMSAELQASWDKNVEEL